MIEIELEKTYLAKYLPNDLDKYPHKEVFDIYIPAESVHPTLRVRKKGDKYEITKKHPLDENDSSEQEEHTIKLTKAEFDSLATIAGKRVRKIRYDYPYRGSGNAEISTGNKSETIVEINAEIAIFQDELKGLVLVDVEFKSSKDKAAFNMPDFCLVDVTDNETFAGGMLCGKKLGDIMGILRGYEYEPLL